MMVTGVEKLVWWRVGENIFRVTPLIVLDAEALRNAAMFVNIDRSNTTAPPGCFVASMTFGGRTLESSCPGVSNR